MSKNSVESWQHKLDGGITAVAITKDGRNILAASLNKTAVCLDNSGKLLWRQPLGNQGWRVGLSGDGKTAVVGTGSTRFWDMKGRGLHCFDEDGSVKWQKDLSASVWGLALSKDGRTIAAGTSARDILLFDEQGSLLWKETVPGLGWWAWVWSASLSADGQVIAAGAADKRLRIFRRTGEMSAEYPTQSDVFATAVAADGSVIAGGDSSGRVYCLDRDGNLLWKETLEDKVWAVALSADGRRLLVGAAEKEAHIRLYNQAGQFLWKRHVGHSVTNVGMSADGRRIIAGTRDGGLYIFDQDAVIHQEQHQKIVRDVAISDNGQWAVAGSEDGRVHTFHLPPLPPTETDITQHDNTFSQELNRKINNHFSLNEFKDLCFELGIKYDDFSEGGMPAKTRQLVLFMERRNQLDDLWEKIREIRPDI